MNTLKLLAAAATVSVMGTGIASAASCSVDDFDLTIATAEACSTGNDTNQIDADYVLFGMDGWVLADKNDSADGDSAIVFTDAPDNGTKSGDWAISSIAGFEKIVITLKAGNGFGAFLLDLTAGDPLAGDWSTDKDLSHASIYYNGMSAEIPLPAAGFLLLGGLGALGIARRRKS